MIHGIDHFAIHDLLELFQVHHETGALVHIALHRNFQGVVVAMAVRIIALAKNALVLLRGEFRIVVVMRR